jgi:hypothetical protein
VGSRTGKLLDPPTQRARRRLWWPDLAQSGTRRHASPREQPLKLHHGVRIRINNHSLPRHVCNYVHRIVLQFYVYFLHVYPSCGQLLFPCLATSSTCAILSQAGLLEVPTTYMVSLGYFLARGPVLPNGCSLKKVMLNRGGPECATCLA